MQLLSEGHAEIALGPFVARLTFAKDYQFVWGKPAKCHYCGEVLTAGDYLVWVADEESDEKRSVAHYKCWRDFA